MRKKILSFLFLFCFIGNQTKIQANEIPNARTSQFDMWRDSFSVYNFSSGLELFDKLVQQKVGGRERPNCEDYNAILQACEKISQPKFAAKYFTMMEQSTHVQPDLRSIQYMIDIHAQIYDFSGAIAYFEKVSELELAPTVAMFNSIISVLARTNAIPTPDAALNWFKKLQSPPYNLTPDIVSINNVVEAYSRRGRAAEAADFIKMAENMGLEPAVHSFHTIIHRQNVQSHEVLAHNVAADTKV